eukprot:4055809-Alexandrium_andersonii.AAC.1
MARHRLLFANPFVDLELSAAQYPFLGMPGDPRTTAVHPSIRGHRPGLRLELDTGVVVMEPIS